MSALPTGESRLREMFNTLRVTQEPPEGADQMRQLFDQLEPTGPEHLQEVFRETLEDVGRYRPSRGGELDKMRRSLGSFAAQEMQQSVSAQAAAGIARDQRLQAPAQFPFPEFEAPDAGVRVLDPLVEAGLIEGQVPAEAPSFTESVMEAASPERRLAELKRLGDILAAEPEQRTAGKAFREFAANPSKGVPFIGSVLESKNLIELWRAAKRLEAGTDTEDDRLLLMNAAQRSREEPTIGARTVDILGELPSFVGEFILTGGLFTLGRKAATRAIGKVTRHALEKSLAGRVATQIPAIAVGAAVQLPAFTHRAIETSIRKAMPGIGVDEAGMLAVQFAKEDESFSEAVRAQLGAGFLDTYIEIWSERTGGALRFIPGISKLSGLKTTILRRWLGIRPGNTAERFLAKVAQRGGWHGVIGEVFEERVGEVARAAVGLEPYRPPSLDQLIAEGIAFSIPGAASLAGQAISAPAADQEVPRGTQPARAPEPPAEPSVAEAPSETGLRRPLAPAEAEAAPEPAAAPPVAEPEARAGARERQEPTTIERRGEPLGPDVPARPAVAAPTVQAPVAAEPVPERVEKPHEEIVAKPAAPAQAPGIKVNALDRSTGKLVEVEVAPNKVTESLREERKTRAQLRQLIDCLGGK